MSGAQMAAGAAHDPANRDYTQIVFAENIIAVIRSPSFYAASRRPVPSEAERIPILPLFHAAICWPASRRKLVGRTFTRTSGLLHVRHVEHTSRFRIPPKDLPISARYRRTTPH